MSLIDTHAHIYLSQFDNDRNDMIARSRDAGITTILMPAIDSTTHASMLETENANQNCLCMMGLHPCSVNESFEKELQIVEEYLGRRKFIAVGEIGLDFYWDKTFAEQQYEAFRRQIDISIKYDLPIVIHSRNSIDECIGVVKEFPSARGVFHCFSGNAEQARQIIGLNFYLGIGGVATFKNGGLDKVLPQIDLSHIVLETDAPYLAPAPFRGKRNEPLYLEIILNRLSEIYKKAVEELGAITSANSSKLFGL